VLDGPSGTDSLDIPYVVRSRILRDPLARSGRLPREERLMRVELKRLSEVRLEDLADLFNDPDVRRHLPLAVEPFTIETCARFVAAKERMWTDHGYGPWAFVVDGEFAGWGGLQPEGPDADLGLVLRPRFWGLGLQLAREILRQAFDEMDRDSVIVLLPPSRTRVRALKRMGFEADGEAVVGRERFMRYRRHNPRRVATTQSASSSVGQMALQLLLEQLRGTEALVATFFAAIPDAELVRRPGEAWSPAEHLDHLNIAVSAVARGFSMSPLLLRLRFGRSGRQSRSYEELRSDYQGRLAAGGRASGRFIPPRSAAASSDAATRKVDLLARWTRVNGRLRDALGTWSERNLDRTLMPHPLLGRITARELAFFTIYHGGHHVEAARRRLAVGPRDGSV
jgi:[ribosomal protein S5]-alanine N-acetyltransferase